MTHPFQLIPDLVRTTLRDPRGAARRIISMDLPGAAMWEALVLVVVLSVIAAQASTLLAGGYNLDATTGSMLPGFFFSPLLLGVFQGVLMTLMVLAVHGVGRMFGGYGALPDATALVVWLQFLMVCLQLLQVILLLVLPGLSGLVGLAGVVLFFYLLTQFICELHGFDRPGLVFGGVLATMMVLILLMSILLGMLGIGYVEIPDV